jgi:hypothetical protein
VVAAGLLVFILIRRHKTKEPTHLGH